MCLIDLVLRYFPFTPRENPDVNDLVDAEVFDEFASLLDRSPYIDITSLVVRICSKKSVKRLRMLRYVVNNYYIPHDKEITSLLSTMEDNDYYKVLMDK